MSKLTSSVSAAAQSVNRSATNNPASKAGKSIDLQLQLNGRSINLAALPLARLSQVLRDAGHREIKIGCDAGDCGACSVLLDGQLVCACLIPAAQAQGTQIQTAAATQPATESAIGDLALAQLQQRLQRSLLKHAATQCGICTPGILMSAVALLAANPNPSREQVQDALGGVLCRCTGYASIIDAIVQFNASNTEAQVSAALGSAIGASIPRVDGSAKVSGREVFGADVIPHDALSLRLIRSPHHSASFAFGDIAAWVSSLLGVERVFTALDIPGVNCFGVIAPFADQPVLAESRVRFRGEPVAAVVGSPAAIRTLDLATFPIQWQSLSESLTAAEAQQPEALQIHSQRPGNILVHGLVQRGEDLQAQFANAAQVVAGRFRTRFVEHGYIEPEAGFVRRVGNRIEVHTCTQTADMARDELAAIMGLPATSVRVVPTAVGGGFGSKLDLSIQPILCVAAWHLNTAVGAVYSRQETMQATTKRHPAEMQIRIASDADGQLRGLEFSGVFNTGAYASWGPTVANRVPVHASGPYYLPHYCARSTAVHTNCAPAGAFRGFGVPQAAIALECMLDQLALELGIDRLALRLNNALQNKQPTVTGQVFDSGVGITACLRALADDWQQTQRRCEQFNQQQATHPVRRGCGVASCWYGCGNTSLPNPSTIKIGLTAEAKIVLHQGAIDLGQGSATVLSQIVADTLGVAVAHIQSAGADTDITPDAGKTSASRQTFVSGNAALRSAQALRARILRQVNAADSAQICLAEGTVRVTDDGREHVIDLATKAVAADGYVFSAAEQYDPPTTALDANGQGRPYAQYGYGAQIVELEVDLQLGTVKILRLISAHDVGRAINPKLVEGQIEGGATQGIGMALMEEFVPGVSENLHDYLIPTIGDIPVFKHHIIEVPDSEGPYGAKGLGEHVLIPTAPAILNAIRHASGAVLRELPATPARVLAAIQESHGD